MSTRPKRPHSQAASRYVEVDSDADMDSEDERVTNEKNKLGSSNGAGTGGDGTARKVGDTFGAGQDDAQNRKKQKKHSKTLKEAKKPGLSFEKFLSMPLDTIVEICSHLGGKDLLSLSRTSKELHSFFRSDAGNSIFASARGNDGLPKRKDVSDRALIALIHGKGCLECGAAGVARVDFQLMTRICRSCRQDLFIAGAFVKKQIHHVHPRATECVDYTSFAPDPDSISTQPYALYGTYYYRRQDLKERSAILWELQDEDDQAAAENVKHAGTRSRPSDTSSKDDVELTAVENFVKAAEVKVDERQKLSLTLWKAWDHKLKADKAEKVRIARELQARIRARKRSIEEKLSLRNWGLELYILLRVDRLYRFARIDSPLTVDEWRVWEPRFVEARNSAKEDQIKGNRAHLLAQQVNQRQELLRPYYDTLGRPSTLPHFYEFLEWPIIREFWELEGAVINQESWDKKLNDIKAGVREHAENKRIQTENQVKADRAMAISDLLLLHGNPPEIDPATVSLDDPFFQLATALVHCPHHWHRETFEPYPSFVHHIQSCHVNNRFFPQTSALIFELIETILATANLPPTSSVASVDESAPRFRWKENRGYKKDKFVWRNWKDLLATLVHRRKKPLEPLTLILVKPGSKYYKS